MKIKCANAYEALVQCLPSIYCVLDPCELLDANDAVSLGGGSASHRLLTSRRNPWSWGNCPWCLLLQCFSAFLPLSPPLSVPKPFSSGLVPGYCSLSWTAAASWWVCLGTLRLFYREPGRSTVLPGVKKGDLSVW